MTDDTSLGDDHIYVPVGSLELTQVPDGVMIYQADRERVHYLNPTAAVVFELCGMNKTVAEIEDFVGDAFGLSDTPAADVRKCLTSLVDEQLLVRWNR